MSENGFWLGIGILLLLWSVSGNINSYWEFKMRTEALGCPGTITIIGDAKDETK